VTDCGILRGINPVQMDYIGVGAISDNILIHNHNVFTIGIYYLTRGYCIYLILGHYPTFVLAEFDIFI